MRYSGVFVGVVMALCVSVAQAADIPNSATLQYSGSYGIPATMTFQRSGGKYTIAANINVPLYKIRFESGGRIVGNQLYPDYYKDIRNGKVYASAKFSERGATYGRAGDVKTEAVVGRVMDLFTLSWQMAFNDGKLPNQLQITNGKKLYHVGGMRNLGSKKMKIDGRETVIDQFVVRRGDDTVAYSFASDFGGVPAVISYNDGDKKYHLTLKSVSINGKKVQP